LAVCDREPIHLPGSIQPHGFLLALDPQTWLVHQASENVSELLGRPLHNVLGRPVDELFPASIAALLRLTASKPLFSRRPMFISHLKIAAERVNRSFALIGHVHRGTIILEGELLTGDDESSRADAHYELETFLGGMEAVPTTQGLLDMAAKETRRITGFDRVLVYQFDPDWNGIVVAEDRNDRLPSYLDLRFPASDIPQQARELYRINRLRLIARASYEPVKLLGRDTRAPVLDLSLSTLRSVSPVHLEYMRNMGTGSSMSISLMREGRLWGLISCHSREPHLVPFDVRATSELLGQVLSMQLAAREQSAALAYRMQLASVLARLMTSMAKHNHVGAGLMAERKDLLALTDAAGVAVVLEGSIELHGRTPTKPQVEALVAWLANHAPTDVLVLDALPATFPPAREYAWSAAGLLAIPISRVHKSYVLWFRPEVVSTVTWGGDPAKPLQTEVDGTVRLHPRKSFEAWVETVRGRSAPWLPPEVESARELRNGIIDIVLQNAERLAAITEELTRTNKELEAFSYTVSHDLRAPFRHIRAYAELLKSDKARMLDNEGREFIDFILNGATYAGRMVDNILAFSQMGRTPLQITDVDLSVALEDLLASLRLNIAGRAIDWNIGPLPTVAGDANMLRAALQNLVENAIKFTRDRAPARIEISATSTRDEHIIAVRDNGVGFDMKFKDKLFGMFQRLHRWEEFEGTGIGLASVRRIIARHGGRVWAESELGQGSTFYIALPIKPIPASPLYA
jgi:light-regulated signal transduction histidine kinase (bacteriophytochrome)